MSYNCAYVGSRWLTYFLFKRTYIRCPMSRRNFEAVVMDTVYAVIHDDVEYVFIAHILIYILHSYDKYMMRNSILSFYDVCNCL